MDCPTQFSFSLCVEVGWRLARQFWKKGYATEGATAVLEYAFNNLNLEKGVSFTASINTQSEAVMKRLGMTKVQDFDSPNFPLNHKLSKHVLYEKYKIG